MNSVIIFFAVLIFTTSHACGDLSVSSSAHGTGVVVASLATSDGYVQEDEQLNQSRWDFDLNNTTLLMGRSTFMLLENGTILPADS
jgi:hypothetical protein